MSSIKSDWLFVHLGKILFAIGIFGLLVAAFVLLLYATYFPGAISTSPTNWGTFGDFVGGSLNPIFGFLGLLALLMTLWVQNRELSQSFAINRSMYVADHRPWIKVDLALASGLERNSAGQLKVAIKFTMENVGKSPAQNVFPHPKAVTRTK